MKWKNKEISEMTDAELLEASWGIVGIHNAFNAARNSPAYIEKRKNKDTPEVNPAFTDLTNTINDELKKRNVVK